MTTTDRLDPSQASDSTAPAIETGKLIVVSNRQPYAHEYEHTDSERTITVDRPAGGLTAGLDPVMQRTGGTWIAWGDGDADFQVADADDSVGVPPDDPAYTLHRVRLSDDDVEGYYYGYSNQGLWPLCHGIVGNASFDDRFWERYRSVNERFAESVAERAAEGTLIWFQDYHFALAPRLVRNRTDETPITQFWHIPWPAWETFRICPQRDALLDGLLANDLLVFHVPEYCETFLDCVEAGLADAIVDRERGRVRYRDHTTAVRPFPLGVDAERIADLSRSNAAREFWREFTAEYGLTDTRVALGVDRLDYTKGIPQRIAALERLFETRPEWRGELTYVQKGTESRSRIEAYQRLQNRVDRAIDRVNDRFGTDDWQPVIRLGEMLPEDELYGLYRYSDVALVSPLRDGMNLVAKEYVASQVDADGVLVLSELAGAHRELGDDAVTINPYDAEGFAEEIETALTLSEEERRARMNRQRARVQSYDLSEWMNDVLATATAIGRTGDPGTADYV